MFGSNRKPSPRLLLKLHTYSPPRLLLPHAYGNVWHVTLLKPVTCTPHSSAAATHDVVIGILVALKQLVAAWPTEFVTFKNKKSLRTDYRQVRSSQVALDHK